MLELTDVRRHICARFFSSSLFFCVCVYSNIQKNIVFSYFMTPSTYAKV